jgi:hypothetical protein
MITSIQDMMMIVIMMIAEWLPPRRELGVYHRRMNVMMLVMMMMMMSRCLPPRISGCLPPQISVKMMITIVTMMSGCLPPRISGCLPPQRSEMRWSRRSRWCQDVYHSIYLGVYQRRMKNMMMLVMMMMMMLSWIHLTRSPFYVITTTWPASRVEQQLSSCGGSRSVWTRGGSGGISRMLHKMQTALQIQVIFDEFIKIAISFTVIAVHIVLLVPPTLQRHMLRQQSSWFRCTLHVHTWCIHACIHAYMHTCEALCKLVM